MDILYICDHSLNSKRIYLGKKNTQNIKDRKISKTKKSRTNLKSSEAARVFVLTLADVSDEFIREKKTRETLDMDQQSKTLNKLQEDMKKRADFEFFQINFLLQLYRLLLNIKNERIKRVENQTKRRKNERKTKLNEAQSYN